MTKLEQLRALLKAGTTRPWAYDKEQLNLFNPDAEHQRKHGGLVCSFSIVTDRDAALIAAAVNALPALLDVAEAARVADAKLHDDCGGCESCGRIYQRLREALAKLEAPT